MNKTVFCIVCSLCIAAGVMWANEGSKTDANGKVKDFSKSSASAYKDSFNGQKVYYFEGFDFLGYKAGDPSIKTLTKREVAAIKNGVSGTVSKATEPYSIIGHSQGGLRVLGYSTYLKKTDPQGFKNLESVITISGIDRGLKALEGGLPGLRSRAEPKINTFGNGLRSIIGIFDMIGVLNQMIPRNRLGDAAGLFLDFLPGELKHYVKEAWNKTDTNSMKQLADMVPGSAYIKEYVGDVTTHTYKKQSGTELVLTGFLSFVMAPVYSYYNAYEDKPKFDPALPVGFIVGLNSNSLSVLKEKEKSVRDLLRGFEIAFGISEGLHIAKCFTLVGLVTGSITYANDAAQARRLMANFDSELNSIKGGSENDGLVALESQYYPKSFYHPGTGTTTTILKKVLGRKSEGFVRTSFNHENIVKDRSTFTTASNMIQESKGY